jgi:hypothetical protein
MSLQYYLRANNITDDPDDYMAVSQSPESYSLEDVFEHMTREGSTITKAEALAGFEEVIQGIVNLVEQGNSVVTPLVNISPSISGVFDGEEDRFDPDRHQVNINVSPGLRLRDTAGDIPTQKIAPKDRVPVLRHFYDNRSDTRNGTITPAGGARITGALLKFDEEDENQGVFFINTSDGSERRVNQRMLQNKPSELIFMLPDLSAGTYRLEVRSNLEFTSEVRKGALSEELTVPGS